jgi:hypothetical protein
MDNANWPDEVRLKMIEKSEFYQDPQIYQYGFYDGYQLASVPSTSNQTLEQLAEQRYPIMSEDEYNIKYKKPTHENYIAYKFVEEQKRQAFIEGARAMQAGTYSRDELIRAIDYGCGFALHFHGSPSLDNKNEFIDKQIKSIKQ